MVISKHALPVKGPMRGLGPKRARRLSRTASHGDGSSGDPSRGSEASGSYRAPCGERWLRYSTSRSTTKGRDGTAAPPRARADSVTLLGGVSPASARGGGDAP